MNNYDVDEIDSPTVGEMIKILSFYPPDKAFRIKDTETEWTIKIIHVYETEHTVWLKGDYLQMDDTYGDPIMKRKDTE